MCHFEHLYHYVAVVFFAGQLLHTSCALVTGFQACALPIFPRTISTCLTEAPSLLSYTARSVKKCQFSRPISPRLGRSNGKAISKIGRASCRERVCQYV